MSPQNHSVQHHTYKREGARVKHNKKKLAKVKLNFGKLINTQFTSYTV